MKKHASILTFLTLIFFYSCSSYQYQTLDINEIEDMDKFYVNIKTLLSNPEFLKKEVILINARQPSIQRIVSEADKLWLEGKLKESASVLERALRVNKNDGSVYLRLSHIKFEQNLDKESKAFAQRGLMIDNLSSWERLLLNIYLKY